MPPARTLLRCAWVALCLLVCSVPAIAAMAMACDGAERIRLHTPVALSAQERAEFGAMPPLRIFAGNAPPLARYDEERGTYTGISADVLCFVSQQMGLRFAFVTTVPDLSIAEKIQQVQDGRADGLVPLSLSPERASKGLFTAPHYKSHYAVIALKGRRVLVASSADLARYRVGFVGGVALEPVLQDIVPARQLHRFDSSVVDKGLFKALRDGTVDVVVFNKGFFSEERYRHELFDLEIVQTLNEFPRAYSFYFSSKPEHQRLVATFDRYLAAMDTSESIEAHEIGERQLIERYVAQRSQRTVLLAASLAAALLALASYLALRKHRSLTLLLTISHAQVLEQQQALQTANEALERLSQTDGLTRLANRRHFDQVLVREHGRYRRKGTPLSVLMIDVDHFKSVNDHLGHAMGDDYLRAVARALERGVARSTDLVARYGGEEFACLLPDTDIDSARWVAEQIRAGVAELGLSNAKADIPHLTVSIGLATLRSGERGERGEHSASALVACADAQLYAAKQAGRNRVCAAVLSAPQAML